MGERDGTRWTTAKILALLIPVFLVVMAVAGTLVLALGKGDAGENEAGEGDTASEEEVLEAYEEIRKQTEAAMAEMEDLESEEAVSDPAVYEQELVEANARAERAYQEVERSKARLERAAAQELEQRAHKLLIGFLDVLDDLDRALSAAQNTTQGTKVIDVDGIQLVRKSFLLKLNEFNVTHVPALHQPFNPDLHDAVTTVSVADKRQNGLVVGVISEGYAVGDRILRPARVAVGKLQ